MAIVKGSRNPRRAAVSLLPNMLTTFNLLCGLLAVLLALESLNPVSRPAGQAPLYQVGSWLIFAAMIFDFLDGKVARWAKVTSPVGVKIDSLADFVSFGVAPSVLAYAALLQHIPTVAQAAACGIFLGAGAWRLARFNCETDNGHSQNFFSGLPIPAAASFIAALVMLSPAHGLFLPKPFGHQISVLPEDLSSWMFAALMLVLAFLMVSRIRFPAFKQVNQSNLILLAGSAGFLGVLLLILPLPNIIFLIMLLYVVFGLFANFIENVLKMQNLKKPAARNRPR